MIWFTTGMKEPSGLDQHAVRVSVWPSFSKRRLPFRHAKSAVGGHPNGVRQVDFLVDSELWPAWE